MPIRLANRGLPIPPHRLIHLVAGTEDVSWFLDSGKLAADTLRTTLARNGLSLASCGAILDFGCGVGRVIRHLADLRGPAIHGSDYNAELIGWCRRNLPFARFQVNGLGRGLEDADASFDFIYALSVFTHLTEDRQDYWMTELGRVLKPGGHLLATIHGDYYLPRLSESERARYRAGEIVVHAADREGSNDCATFHPPAYVRERLARGWNVIDHVPEGALGHPRQDVYLLRKPT